MQEKHMGTLMAVISAVSWSFTGLLGRLVGWNVISVVGVRSLIAALLLGLARGGYRIRPSKGTLLGSAGVALTTMFYFLALPFTSAANAIVLQYAMTGFVILFCWLFLRQRPSRADLITAAVVMLGVLLCSLQGMRSGTLLGDFFALLSAVSFSMVFFCARMPDTRPEDYAYLGNVFAAVLSVYVFFDPAVGARAVDWLYILLIGLGQSGGYFFLCKATRKASSPLAVALTINIEPVLNPMWVFLFLGEKPGWLTFVGAAVVLGAVTVYSVRGAKRSE